MKISLPSDKIPGSQHNFGHGINYMTKALQINEKKKLSTPLTTEKEGSLWRCYVCWVESSKFFVCTVKETSVNLNKFLAELCLRINSTEAFVNLIQFVTKLCLRINSTEVSNFLVVPAIKGVFGFWFPGPPVGCTPVV